MTIIDVLESKDIDQLGQVLLGALDRLREIVAELRDEARIKIVVTFERKEFSCLSIGKPLPPQ